MKKQEKGYYFHCRECGKRVEANDYHPFEACLEWKQKHGGYFEDKPGEVKDGKPTASRSI